MSWTEKQDGEKLFAADINEVAHMAENGENALEVAESAEETANAAETKATTALANANTALATANDVADDVADLADNVYTKNEIDTALVAYATKASPAFTGTPTAPTATTGTNTTQIATTAFVQGEIADKQDNTVIIQNLTGTANIANNTEIRQQYDIYDTPLTITLPSNSSEQWLVMDTEFIGSVIFQTGASSSEIGTVNIPTSVVSGIDTIPVIYKGEDITSETVNNATVYTFTPTENKRYTFMCFWDGSYMVCEVTGYELP